MIALRASAISNLHYNESENDKIIATQVKICSMELFLGIGFCNLRLPLFDFTILIMFSWPIVWQIQIRSNW